MLSYQVSNISDKFFTVSSFIGHNVKIS